ncbi:MAG: S-methyl-5-thioribose-1-phosphate isomerase [Thermoplasmata archaeon]|nr:S-methyl-5-thioribose-1-phosphate isomerase [Thermoplasmata archaeon]
MLVKTGNDTREISSVWMENSDIVMIDQRLLPEKLEFFRATNTDELCFAIREMVVRGAPAIGVAAAFGIAQAKMQHKDLRDVAEKIKSQRPTAHDLFYAVDECVAEIEKGSAPEKVARDYCNRIVEECRKIGEVGEKLIFHGSRVLTHCNAGALATVDWGTALAPLRMAKRKGRNFFVFVDETRPRLQGARLTAWELGNEGIEHAVIADNAAGYYMARGDVDIVITGADRITANGDFANKIGTYEKAVVAKENGLPFYVAAPLSTFDFNLKNGRQIKVEMRGEEEVHLIDGTRITPETSRALNPAFDITPARYVTGFITAFGIFRPSQIFALKEKWRCRKC